MKMRFTLKLDREMHENLKKVAKAERRTVKKQIVVLLRDFLDRYSKEDIVEMLKKL